MAIERPPGGLCLSCDECGNELDSEFDADSFREMIAYAKRKGWSVTADQDMTGGWRHLCPEDNPRGIAAQRRLLGRR